MPKSAWQEFKENKEVSTHEFNAWVEGRHIMYHPTMYPTPEVKEWGGRWDGKNKCWRLPRLTRMAKKIQDYDEKAKMSRDVKVLLIRDYWDPSVELAELGLDDYMDHPHISELYPYQVQAVFALVHRKYSGKMLILSPGLGKTPTAIIAADIWAQKHKIKDPKFLVVCPKSLVPNWTREIGRWSRYDPDDFWSKVEIVNTTNKDLAGTVPWTVTNPEAVLERTRAAEGAPLRVTGNLDPNFDQEWTVVILDESVLYKNRKSKRSQVIKTLASKANQVFELSGAPTTHDNSDIWQQLNIIEPDYFSSFWRLANEFCVVERTPWSNGEIVGSRKGMELRAEFPELMFVRNQEEVFEDLPRVVFQDIELPLTKRQKKAHDDLMDIWMHQLAENLDSRVDVTAVISQLIRLQQVTSNLKNLETTGKRWPDESTKADFICEALETGDVIYPLLVWSHHRPGGEALRARIERLFSKGDLKGQRVELVQGGNKRADNIIQDFKRGDVHVLILSIGVGKYGHTLANVRDVIYLDKTWDSDAWFQSLHRYAGARGKLAGYDHNVRCRVLRCRGTVDDFVEMNLAGKLPDMAKVTGADLLKILRSIGANFIEEWEAQ